MSYITTQRIKSGGKYYAAGEPIKLTDEALAELPDGAVNVAPENEAPAKPEDLPPFDISNDAHLEKLTEAVAKLPEKAWRKDGVIRAGNLINLSLNLGFELTTDDVAAAKPAPENG